MVRQGFRYEEIIKQTILFVDQQNFLNLAAARLFPDERQRRSFNPLLINYAGLFATVLFDLKVDRRLVYAAKIRRHPDSAEKSNQLIEQQRQLKTLLTRQGFQTIIAGSVRGNYLTEQRGRKTLIFKEKGVDVRLAVDTVALAWDGQLKTAIIGSSDSDLQPAVDQLKQRKVTVIYLGFEARQNRGLTYTCDRTVLIGDRELRASYTPIHKS